MTAVQSYLIDGWNVEFHRNIHMYSHSLKLSRDGENYDVFCEDTPGGFVGIWPYELNIADALLREILAVLRKWACQLEFQYRLYTSKNEYEGNDRAEN